MYKYLLKAPARKVDSVLNSAYFITPAARVAAKEEIKAAKNTTRIGRLKAGAHAKLWNALLRHLKYERANCLTSLKYYRQRVSMPHIKAFEAYTDLLTNLMLKMEKQKRAGQFTPSQIAREKKFANHGSHWTDWVGEQKKELIREMFTLLPHTAKAKRKIPFERNIRPDPKAKDRLYERTTNEYRTEAIKQKLLPSDERAALLAKMDAALVKITQLKPTDFVPHTWHGLYTEKAKESEQ